MDSVHASGADGEERRGEEMKKKISLVFLKATLLFVTIYETSLYLKFRSKMAFMCISPTLRSEETIALLDCDIKILKMCLFSLASFHVGNERSGYENLVAWHNHPFP